MVPAGCLHRAFLFYISWSSTPGILGTQSCNSVHKGGTRISTTPISKGWTAQFRTLDRECTAIQCMDIHRYPWISKQISIKARIIEDKYQLKHGYTFMGIYCLRIFIAECPSIDIPAWISMWISTLVWIIEDWHKKIMDIHVDIRGFSGIHVKIYAMDSRTREINLVVSTA